MRYSALIIDSSDFYDYVENSADGVRYDNLEKSDLDGLIELSLEQNFSVIVRKYENEE